MSKAAAIYLLVTFDHKLVCIAVLLLAAIGRRIRDGGEKLQMYRLLSREMHGGYGSKAKQTLE